MMQTLMKRGLRAVVPLIAVFCWTGLLPAPLRAIPAFARRYNLKCYSCHTIPPALNKNGYMFKRLGYRLPPDEMDGKKPWPKIGEIDKEKFDLTKAFAIVSQGSFTADKSTASGSPVSSTSFNLDEAALFTAGAIPETNFSYFVHYELFQGGSNFLEQAIGYYTGGKANSSYFIKAGQMHAQEGEGTRAAMFYNLFPDPALTLTNIDPNNFTLDQHPVGVGVGYTWASPYFKQIFAVSGKVTNGLNADGSEITFNSTKNSKDYWIDADYWFGPDGGITFMTYHGTKDQIQNQGGSDEFTFRPRVRRYGILGNYLFFDKLDVLGGYIRSNDDWKDAADGPTTNYIANGFRGEVDYYIQNGFALMARYDHLSQSIAKAPSVSTQAWGVGASKALTALGNIVLRVTYNHEHDTDPVSGTVTADKLFKVDVRLMW
jgi:hypothetical protein